MKKEYIIKQIKEKLDKIEIICFEIKTLIEYYEKQKE